jgi:very-short-patch-repair endonuclease
VTSLHAEDVATRFGLAVTSPARTLLDLAGAASSRAAPRRAMADLERAVADAERRGVVTRAELAVQLQRYPRRKGCTALRALIERDVEPALSRSEAEVAFLRLVRSGRLPEPRTNAKLHGLEVDLLWPRERVVVEVDGFDWHRDRTAFERDRYRDGILAAAGFLVVRVTWRQITREPQALLVRLARVLARRGAERSS